MNFWTPVENNFSNTSGSVPFLLTGNSECMASAHRKGCRISLLPCSADNILTWITLHTIHRETRRYFRPSHPHDLPAHYERLSAIL